MIQVTNRRNAMAQLAMLATAALSSSRLLAQPAYPSKVVRLIVPTAPGGSVDSAGRLLAEALSKQLHGSFIVDNRSGAGGVIGIDAAAKSAPDGYTLVLGIAATLAGQPALRDNLPYQAARDLTPLAVFAQGGLVLAVPASSPVQTLQDLRRLAEKKGELTFGTGGLATFGHLTGEVVKSALPVPMRHIPYRGAAPAVTDLAAGLLDLAVVDAFSALPHVEGGRIRVIATAGPARHVSFPQVPTLTEAGLPFERGTWIGLFAPAGVPRAVVERLTGAVSALSKQPTFRADVAKLGFTPVFVAPAEVTRMLEREVAAWKADARQAAVQLD